MAETTPNWYIAFPVNTAPCFAHIPSPPAKVRAFEDIDRHMTLAFLGAVTESQAHKAFALASVWPVRRGHITLGPVRPMGNPQRFTALSALVIDDTPELRNIMFDLRARMLEAAKRPAETRPVLPHVTLARLHRRATREQRAEALRWADGLDLGQPVLPLSRIALYTWHPTRESQLFRIADESSIRG